MTPLNSSFKTPLRSVVALAFLALAGHAGAVSSGSTDIWGNSFRQSFGAPDSSTSHLNAAWNGSTDVWANQFVQSFGGSEAAAQPATGSAVGSTDLWGNGFAASFGSPSLPASAQLVRTRQSEVNSVHSR